MESVYWEKIGNNLIWMIIFILYIWKIRHQAKDLNLLGTILPYETEGQFELSIMFADKLSVSRGNLILPENVCIKFLRLLYHFEFFRHISNQK